MKMNFQNLLLLRVEKKFIRQSPSLNGSLGCKAKNSEPVKLKALSPYMENLAKKKKLSSFHTCLWTGSGLLPSSKLRDQEISIS